MLITCPDCKTEVSDAAPACPKCARPLASAAQAGASVQNWMKLASAADASGNHDEAYGYFTRVLEVEPNNHRAWFGKAIAAGWGSNLRNDRLAEMTSGIEQALTRAPDGDRATLKKQATEAVGVVVVSYYKLSDGHTHEFITVDTAWPEHVSRCTAMVAAMQKAIEWSPANRDALDLTLLLVDALLRGIEYPKGEFKDGFAYLNVPDSMRPRLEALRADLIAKIKRIDPSFAPKEIKPVSGPGCGCILGVIAGAVVVLFIILMILAKLSQG